MNIIEAKFIIKYKSIFSKDAVQKAQQRIDKTKQNERK